jgi:hypothetical protein
VLFLVAALTMAAGGSARAAVGDAASGGGDLVVSGSDALGGTIVIGNDQRIP